MSMPVLPPVGSVDEPMVGVEESSNSDSIATTVTSQPGTPRPVDSENTRSAAATPIPSNPGTPRPDNSTTMLNTGAVSRSTVDTPPVDDSKMATAEAKAKTVASIMAAAGAQPRPGKAAPSKYAQLLNVIEDLGKDIRPTYASSKSSAERLKRGIVHARILVRECLLECERAARS